MADTNCVPAEVFHPSKFIADEMAERGWTQHDLAVRMGGDAAINFLTLDLYRIVGPNNPNCRLGDDTATAIGRAFGTSAEFWLNLETAWRARVCH